MSNANVYAANGKPRMRVRQRFMLRSDCAERGKFTKASTFRGSPTYSTKDSASFQRFSFRWPHRFYPPCCGNAKPCMLFEKVRILRQLGVPVLLVSLLSPVITCVMPGPRMNAQERACCRAMGPECGQPGMSMTHSCCRGSLPGLHSRVEETQTVAFTLLPFAVMYPSTCVPASRDSSADARVTSADTSPSGSPPTSVSILRI